MSEAMLRARAIAEYHELLSADAGLTAELFARLKAAMRARQLLYGAREIGVALRPHLLTRRQYARLARAARLVARAFERIGAAWVCRMLPSLIGPICRPRASFTCCATTSARAACRRSSARPMNLNMQTANCAAATFA